MNKIEVSSEHNVNSGPGCDRPAHYFHVISFAGAITGTFGFALREILGRAGAGKKMRHQGDSNPCGQSPLDF